ncbi:hypothetical protein N8971_02595 [Flavobacteriaceae bacterium]|jgi:hypothetical protein|nr:hypothetical protein [Flavobacteriaceae bacterium]MDC0386611.1 hypothetical protein [Flavobacteriaceae bacterium]
MWNPNNTERRILDKIKAIKKPNRKIVVRKPKKNLKDEKQLQKIEDVLFNPPKGQKATVTLDKVLKLLK